MDHGEVISNFAERKQNKKTGRCEWHGSRVYCEDADSGWPAIIYSYGSHFPLAVFLGVKDDSPLFLKNGDRYSNSTSGHQSLVQKYCKGPTVSCSALVAAGLDFRRVELDQIVDYWSDMRERLFQDEVTGRLYQDYELDKDGMCRFKGLFKKPKQGQWMPYINHADGSYISGVWHCLGTVLFRVGNRHLLCSLDENSYFVSELPAPCRTIKQAFQLLKPPAVRSAERRGIEVLRQGEWFFIPTGLTDRALAEQEGSSLSVVRMLARRSELPRQSANSTNRHVCKCYVIAGKAPYCKGKVFHKNNFGVTGEHRTLDLGNLWHEAHRNTELASWSQGGRFD